MKRIGSPILNNLRLRGTTHVLVPRFDWLFKRVRILRVEMRPAKMYWRYPYIQKIVYAKQWSETTVFGGQHVTTSSTVVHETRTYTVKHRTKESIEEWYDDWKALGDVSIVLTEIKFKD